MAERIALAVDLAFSVEDCISCGIQFALPAEYLARLRTSGQTFYCPNGHTMWFGRSEADKLRERLQRVEAQVVHHRDQAAAAERARSGVERQLAATKGQVTKLRNRAAGGVCPCCNRTFVALGRHMATKHPEFATGADGG